MKVKLENLYFFLFFLLFLHKRLNKFIWKNDNNNNDDDKALKIFSSCSV